MNENPLNTNKVESSLSEVSVIEKTRGIFISKREQIKDIVEKPLLKACEVFWDKNIKTYESSANSNDIKEGFCWIRIDFNTLSDENKNIGIQIGKQEENNLGENTLEIKIPVTEITTIDEISNMAVEIANKFKRQKATWISGTTLKEQLDFFERKVGKDYPVEFAKEKERLSQPGVWAEECKKSGKYFDPETQTAWENEELYKKANEDITKIKIIKKENPKITIIKK